MIVKEEHDIRLLDSPVVIFQNLKKKVCRSIFLQSNIQQGIFVDTTFLILFVMKQVQEVLLKPKQSKTPYTFSASYIKYISIPSNLTTLFFFKKKKTRNIMKIIIFKFFISDDHYYCTRERYRLDKIK